MTTIKIIKTEEDYRQALKMIEELMNKNPEPESTDGEKLALLATLVQDYESKKFPETLPDPIEAIKFRMEQENLKPIDLVPYIGSRSRVSEILSGKRQLTLEMMRALEAGLGIPAKVLLKKTEEGAASMFKNWNKNVLKEMSLRGCFGKRNLASTHDNSDLVENFFTNIGSSLQLQFQGMLRQAYYRSAPATDKQALTAWAGCVLKKAKKIETTKKYSEGSIDLVFMQKIARFSVEKNSPLLVQDFLKRNGIILVVEPPFAKTRLDGATLFANKNNPIIGLTLRLNRLDNFWFTLMHELAHIALHYNDGTSIFYDELDDIKGFDVGFKEKEADNFASEALVPANKWEVSPARLVPSTLAAISLAKQLGVDVTIVAGKIRYESGNYTYLNKIIGQATVRQYFPHEKWKEQ